MTVTIPDELLQSDHLTELELRVEIAVTLFQQDRFTLGQAALFANLGKIEMQRILASRRIPLHYTMEDLEEDLALVERRLSA